MKSESSRDPSTAWRNGSARRLLQDVSHELRSPLARMSFATELARRPENLDVAIDRINIVRNAIRYAPEGSCIEVRLEESDNSVRASVRDYGEGVPEESLDKLCRPFFRVDDSRSTSSGGVGLGLAIAQRAIRLHDGTLRVQNAHPGLQVSVELPVCQS